MIERKTVLFFFLPFQYHYLLINFQISTFHHLKKIKKSLADWIFCRTLIEILKNVSKDFSQKLFFQIQDLIFEQLKITDL